jgi:hypothetical protein
MNRYHEYDSELWKAGISGTSYSIAPVTIGVSRQITTIYSTLIS